MLKCIYGNTVEPRLSEVIGTDHLSENRNFRIIESASILRLRRNICNISYYGNTCLIKIKQWKNRNKDKYVNFNFKIKYLLHISQGFVHRNSKKGDRKYYVLVVRKGQLAHKEYDSLKKGFKNGFRLTESFG